MQKKTLPERKWRRLFADENLSFDKAYDIKVVNIRQR